jgi:hypothetical protein
MNVGWQAAVDTKRLKGMQRGPIDDLRELEKRRG